MSDLSELDQDPPKPGRAPRDSDFAHQAEIDAEIEAAHVAADSQHTLSELPESARTPDQVDAATDRPQEGSHGP